MTEDRPANVPITDYAAQELISWFAKERVKGEPSGEAVTARLSEAIRLGADIQGLVVCLADQASRHLRSAARAQGRTLDEQIADERELGLLARLDDFDDEDPNNER